MIRRILHLLAWPIAVAAIFGGIRTCRGIDQSRLSAPGRDAYMTGPTAEELVERWRTPEGFPVAFDDQFGDVQ